MRSKHVLLLLGLGMLLCSACVPLGGQWYIDIKNDSSEEILVATGCKKENRLSSRHKKIYPYKKYYPDKKEVIHSPITLWC